MPKADMLAFDKLAAWCGVPLSWHCNWTRACQTVRGLLCPLPQLGRETIRAL